MVKVEEPAVIQPAEARPVVNAASSARCRKYSVPVGFTARENTFIFEGNNIQPFVEIGENVIVWSCNHIGHHGSIENHCFLGSNISMAGSVRVGENCFIGGSACIDPQVHLGAYTLLGMQAHVSSDTAPYTTVSGPVSRTRKVNSMQVKLK